jgi:hypothetical protein
MKRVDYLKFHRTEDANCLKMILKDKNEKLIEYETLFKKMKTEIKEQRKIIEENENTMKEQQNEISKFKNLSNILQKKMKKIKKNLIISDNTLWILLEMMMIMNNNKH